MTDVAVAQSAARAANGRTRGKTTAKTTKPATGKAPAKPPKRERLKRVDVPASQRWLNWEEAESVSRLSRNTLRKHLKEIGAKRKGVRLIIDRHMLDAWLEQSPAAT